MFTHPFTVRDYECDLQGIVNNAIYLHYLEHARHVFLKTRGVDFAALHAQGIDPVVVRIEVDYKVSLRSGDEFSVIMPSSNLRDSFNIAKRIQNSVAKLTSELRMNLEEPLTTSFGLATYEEHTPMSVDTFFKRADLELYEAKKSGKNQISFGRAKRIETAGVSEEEKAALAKLMRRGR